MLRTLPAEPRSRARTDAGAVCFDYQAPWLHGYTQEIPAYSGFHSFRPYNYKHVLNQSQIVGGWGLSPASPYSQQYWHRPKQ